MGMFADLLAPFNHVLFFIGDEGVTWAEILGFVTGLTTVFLIVRQHMWNFPIGMLNNVFFFILFIDAAFYADAWLQVFYFVLAIVGWVAWLKAGPGRTQLKVSVASWKLMAGVLVGVAITAWILYPILRDAHGSYPFWDSTTTSLSIGATFLLSFKKIQNWFLWIVADLIYIPLYAVKGLYLTSIVYICFLCLCLMGLRMWSLALRERDPEAYDNTVLFPVKEAA